MTTSYAVVVDDRTSTSTTGDNSPRILGTSGTGAILMSVNLFLDCVTNTSIFDAFDDIIAYVKEQYDLDQYLPFSKQRKILNHIFRLIRIYCAQVELYCLDKEDALAPDKGSGMLDTR